MRYLPKFTILFFCISAIAGIRAQTIDLSILQNQWKAFWITVPGEQPNAYAVYLFRKNIDLPTNYNIPKSTVEEVRAQMEADLLKAADLLSETYDDADKGRVSKGAAWGLLAKVYLLSDKLDKAQKFGSKVITHSPYA